MLFKNTLQYNKEYVCRLYLIRHGSTTFNQAHVPAGRFNDPDLSPLGIAQAEATRKFLVNDINDNINDINPQPPLIYSSTYLRAQRTAKIISNKFSKFTVATPLLDEVSFGGPPPASLIEHKSHVRSCYERWDRGARALHRGGGDCPFDDGS